MGGNSRYLIFGFFPYDQYGQFRLGEITYCIGPLALYCFLIIVSTYRSKKSQ